MQHWRIIVRLVPPGFFPHGNFGPSGPRPAKYHKLPEALVNVCRSPVPAASMLPPNGEGLDGGALAMMRMVALTVRAIGLHDGDGFAVEAC